MAAESANNSRAFFESFIYSPEKRKTNFGFFIFTILEGELCGNGISTTAFSTLHYFNLVYFNLVLDLTSDL
jgi:hypothetical protein